MALYEVQGPGGEVFEIEGADDADPSAVIAQITGQQTAQQSAAASPPGPQESDFTRGARDIAQSILDLPGVGTAANLSVGAYNTGVKALSGLAGIVTGGNPEAVRGVQETLSVEPAQTRDPVWQSLVGMHRVAERVTAPVERAVAGMSPGARTVIEATAEAIPDVAGVLGARVPLKSAARTMQEVRAARAATPKVPTSKELADAADQAYQRADAAGVVISPQSMTRAASSVREVAKKQNLNSKLHPKAAAAVEHLEEVAAQGKPLTLKEADQLRQVVKDAQTSIDKADRRMASIVLRRFDDYLQKLGPQDTLAGRTTEGIAALNEARTIYRRKSNAETIEKAIQRAETEAEGKYTQAGLEHALRVEFKKIARNEKLMRTYTPEQRAAIEQVVKGGKVTNALRNLGKYDPARAGMGATLGGITGGSIGAAIGGIAGAGAGAGGGMLAGQAALGTVANLASRGARRRTQANVERARETLVGRGLPEAREAARKSPTSVPEIQAEMRALERYAAALPSDDPELLEIDARYEVLREELALAGSRGRNRVSQLAEVQ